MTDGPTRRTLLGAVAAATSGLAACLGGRSPTDGGGAAGTTSTTTGDATGRSTTTTDGPPGPARRNGRPAVVDLDLSTAFGAVLGEDPEPVSAFGSVAAEFGRVVADGEAYGVAFRSPGPGTAVCQAVPSHNVAVVARPADPPDGVSVPAVSDLPEGPRTAVERAVESGSYTASRIQGGVGTVGDPGGTTAEGETTDAAEATTGSPDTGDLPPLAWLRADRPYLVGTFRWQSPSCTVAVDEFTLVPAEGASGPAVGAVDATGEAARAAIGGVDPGGGAYGGSGDPPAALDAVARFDYAARVDSRTATYYRPSLSVDDGYRFRLDPVVSGTVGP